jgi:fibronectin type 3 domain-containing protein
LSYQWYRSASNSGSGASAISGATASVLPAGKIDVSAAGTTWYYVVVTNTNNARTGNKTAAVSSALAAITVLGAQTPELTAHPQSAVYEQGAEPAPLTVTAQVSDGGTLSYQWYRNTEYSSAGGNLLAEATDSSYTPNTGGAGTTYYYVVVTNTKGGSSAQAASAPAAITVNNPSGAAYPVILVHPQGAAYYLGDTAAPLTVEAESTDGGTLSYQWYRKTEYSSAGGNLLAEATDSSYTPYTGVAGTTFYYYVVVTNTKGGSSAQAVSAPAAITVNSPSGAAYPVILVHPQGAAYYLDDTAAPLTVTAQVTDGGTLSYQWYRNTEYSSAGGNLLAEATDSSYTPYTGVAGTTYYYYVVVTNTKGDSSAQAVSAPAAITVLGAQTPVITAHPLSASYYRNETAAPLTVTAEVSDGGTLSYQWYGNEGTMYPAAQTASFTPSTAAAGTFSYCVVVTNTKGTGEGSTASVQSALALITVKELDSPIILEQPRSARYTQDADPVTQLSVTASPPASGGTLSFQWYRSTVNSSAGGTPLGSASDYAASVDGYPNARTAYYTPPVHTAGTFYYYAVVTCANLGQTTTAVSAAVMIIVDESVTLLSGAAEVTGINAGATQVTFTLTSTNTGVWKVYDTAEGGAVSASVSASFNTGTKVLTLTSSSAISPKTYWVSVTEAGKSESARLALWEEPDSGADAMSLAARFNIPGNALPSGAADKVSAVFNLLHGHIAAAGASGPDTTVPGIALGDWVDLPSLTVAEYGAIGGGIDITSNTAINGGANGYLLRLIVVGNNSFHSGKGRYGWYNVTANDSTPHLVFQFQNIPGIARMNPTNNTAGGYASCMMRSYLKSHFLAGLTGAGVPDAVLFAPTRYVANGSMTGDYYSGSYTIIATAADEIMDKVWLPTEREMFGASGIDWTGMYSGIIGFETQENQARFEYYNDFASDMVARRTKYTSGGGDYQYWEASPGISTAALSTGSFCVILGYGYAGGSNPGTEVGVAPAFCVK